MIYEGNGAVFNNTKQLINQLDQAFAECIKKIQQIKPLEHYKHNKRWTFQFRSNLNGKNEKGITIEEILRQKPIYKEFLVINQQLNLLPNNKQSTISSIKSLHTERVKLQFMCEDDKYEQEKFQQSNQYLLNKTLTDEQETDYETDSDINDDQEDFKERKKCSSATNKPNDDEIRPLTSTNKIPICTINDENMSSSDNEEILNGRKQKKKIKQTTNNENLIFERYNLSHNINRENFHGFQYSSEDDDQSQSLSSPNILCRDYNEDEDDEEEDF